MAFIILAPIIGAIVEAIAASAAVGATEAVAATAGTVAEATLGTAADTVANHYITKAMTPK